MPTSSTRSTQHVGLLVATTATAMAFGLVFAVVYALLHRRDVDADPWGRALRLAAAAFTGIWLLPFLRYPANPPGVGDPGTIGLRTNAWLAAIAISLIAVVLAWKIHSHLVARGTSAPLRQLAVAGLLIATLASLFALPDNPDTVDVPAILLWNFRLLSVAASGLLWATLGVTFGLLGRKAEQRAVAASPGAAARSASNVAAGAPG